MFTLEHFIWLAICIVIVAVMLITYKKFNLSFDAVLNIMLIVSACSEVTKTLCNMQAAPKGETGFILDPSDLPFHLCSLQIFFMFGLKFLVKSEQTKQKLLGFMAPTMLIGATMALFIPTVGVKFNVVQVYQYFIYHAFLIFFGIYIIKEKLVNWTWKGYFLNLAYLGCLAIVVTWINSVLQGVNPKVNFMYLVRPPMDNLPLLNLNNGWGAYMATLMGLCFILMALFQVIVIAIDKKRNRAI